MKIIFIDVDGVFNRCDDDFIYTTPAPHQRWPHVVDMNVVAMFNHVVQCLNEFEDVRVVVSSAWRLSFELSEDFSVATGIANEYIHEDWRTDFIGRSADRVRHLEVDRWLKNHPECTGWVTFDDLPFDFPKKNFIKTDGLVGLEVEHLKAMCRKFGYELIYVAGDKSNNPNKWIKFSGTWAVRKIAEQIELKLLGTKGV